MTDGTRIGYWHSQRKTMEIDRLVTRALRGGTKAMRAMGTNLTPMDYRERLQTDEYTSRLKRTFLFPAYDEAVSGITDKPFQRAIELKNADKLPESLQSLEWDCDRQGTPLTEMGRHLLDTLADTGLAMLLVDKPGVMVTDGEGTPARAMTLAEEEAGDVRPYFSFVHPDSIINWSWRRENGRTVLAMIAIYSEDQQVDPSTHIEATIQTVRVWTESEWQVWQREARTQTPMSSIPVGIDASLDAAASTASRIAEANERAQYQLVDTGANPIGRVPLVWRNVSRMGGDRLVAKPPLIDLAWCNVDDWLVTSALSNNLHWHSYPALWIAGASADQADGSQSIVYGAGATILSRNENMSVGFVETQGAAATKLSERLMQIRQQEQTLGLAPFLEQVAAGNTATGIDAAGARSQSRVQSWTEQLEWLIYDAYAMAMLWETKGASDELPEDFDIDIFRDFGLPTRAQTDLAILVQARTTKEITQATFLRELKKRGTLGEEVDVDAEVSETEAEQPSMADLMPMQVPGQPPQQMPGQDGEDAADEEAAEEDPAQ